MSKSISPSGAFGVGGSITLGPPPQEKIMFDRFISPFPMHNETLAKARELQLELKAQAISVNPRIVINEVGGGALAMVPESDETDTSDFPYWAKVNQDTTIKALQAGSPPLTDDVRLYYAIWVPEADNRAGEFCCVGDIVHDMQPYPGLTLREAVNVK